MPKKDGWGLVVLERPKPEIHPEAATLWGILKDRGFTADYYDICWAWRRYSREQGSRIRWIAPITMSDDDCFAILMRYLKVSE